ncbi:MAG: glutamate 5-kinase [Coriobacteriia bacterium]|nr:glutamate 5-kinase [Coriobacteriia bacterium]
MTEEAARIIVVKIGSSTLVDDAGVLDRPYLAELAQKVAMLKEHGWNPVVVTSGSIACALPVLGFDRRPEDMPSLQAAASVGTNILFSGYTEEFAKQGLLTSTVLLTRSTTAHRKSYLRARNTLLRLIELGVVPVVNENDTVSLDQIKFGDNDTLAALVSCLIKADLCVLFSDIDGLYTANPNSDPAAQLIPRVEKVTPEIMGLADGVGSSVGSGGMATKLRAARVLMVAGIPMLICHGRKLGNLDAIAQGKPVGTLFDVPAKRHEITPRKLWIALGDTVKGAVFVDDGAKAALEERGSSLLPVGMTHIEGSFAIGDVIDVKDSQGRVIARGLAGATSDEAELACGWSQTRIQSNELLRDLAERPMIHRDELVVFE